MAETVCSSCGGTGWVSFVHDGHCYASGPCRCVGGNCWLGPPPQLSQDERDRLERLRAEVAAMRADDEPWIEYTGPGT